MIIRRWGLERFLLSSGMRLLYGRRKTGKTFYARLVLEGYEYFIVRRGGTIYDPREDAEISVGALARLCGAGSRIILDEFHRAPPRLFDAVHAGECRGDLVFITSTLHYYRRFMDGPEAPLQGLFKPYRVGLVSPLDLLSHDWGWRPRVWELVYYQEPMLIGWSLEDIARSIVEIARGLLGDVLHEEDAAYTSRFDAVLEAIALGRQRQGEIAGWLRAKGLLEGSTGGSVSKYLTLMTRIGLLERIPVLGRRRGSIYRHASPLTHTAYYLQARYLAGETPLPAGFTAERITGEIAPRLFEVFVERLLSEAYGLRPVVLPRGANDIDVALARERTLWIAAEVKAGRVSRADVRRAEERLAQVQAKRRLLVLADKSLLPAETWLEVLDLQDLARIALNARKAGKQG